MQTLGVAISRLQYHYWLHEHEIPFSPDTITCLRYEEDGNFYGTVIHVNFQSPVNLKHSILVSNPLSLQCCKKTNFKSTKRRIIWRVLGSFSVWQPVNLTDDVNKEKGAHKTIKPQHELTKQRENTTAFHTKVNLFPETMLWVWATKKKKMNWSV